MRGEIYQFALCIKPITSVIPVTTQTDTTVTNTTTVQNQTDTKTTKTTTTTPSRPVSSYSWSSGAYGSCSGSCTNAVRLRSVVCKRSDGTSVPDAFCTTTKPQTFE